MSTPDLTACIREYCDAYMKKHGHHDWNGCLYDPKNARGCAACIPEVKGGHDLYERRKVDPECSPLI